MFHRLKAQATDDAQTRSTSHTSWRDRILLGTLSLALGKMGVTACGQVTTPAPAPGIVPCFNTVGPAPLYAPVGQETRAAPATISACTGSLNPNAGCAPAVVNVTYTTGQYKVLCPGLVVFTVIGTSVTPTKTNADYTCYFGGSSS